MLPTPTMLDTLERRFGLTWLSHGGDQINVRCPYCHKRGMSEDKSGHLGINTRINKVHCIRCDWGFGNASKWLEGFDVHLTVTVRDVMQEVTALKDIFERKKPVFDRGTTPPPREFRLIRERQSDCFTDSLEDKGISKALMLSNGIGYCDEGKYDGYVIFPFLEEDEVVYFQGRAAYPSLLEDPKTKKKNPASQNGMGKSSWLYGIHRAKKRCRMVVVEGTLDQISLQNFFDRLFGDGTTVVSTQGTSLSFPEEGRHPLNSQWGKLAYFDPDEVLIMFDPDAYKKAMELAGILHLTGINSRAVCLQNGDPNEISRLPNGDSIFMEAINSISELDNITHTLKAAYA